MSIRTLLLTVLTVSGLATAQPDGGPHRSTADAGTRGTTVPDRPTPVPEGAGLPPHGPRPTPRSAPARRSRHRPPPRRSGPRRPRRRQRPPTCHPPASRRAPRRTDVHRSRGGTPACAFQSLTRDVVASSNPPCRAGSGATLALRLRTPARAGRPARTSEEHRERADRQHRRRGEGVPARDDRGPGAPGRVARRAPGRVHLHRRAVGQREDHAPEPHRLRGHGDAGHGAGHGTRHRGPQRAAS